MSRPASLSLESDTVCPLCLDLDPKKYCEATSGQYIGEPIMLYDLVVSARLGCKGCRILAFAVETHALQDDTAEIVVTKRNSYGQFICTLYRKRSNSDSSKPQYMLIGNEFEQVEECARLELGKVLDHTSNETTWPKGLPISVPISGYTGSKDAIDRAYGWLKTCITEHGCRGPVYARLSTRILRIEGHKKVRLHISDGEIGSYACLSHCWGDRLYAPLKTTSATLDAFRAEVPWKDLPRTFRHAITFCYRLGISYLWIDSLCILQDSDDDWRHEGSKMADIYESALFTLAATKAANPTEGCFSVADDRYKSRYVSFPTGGFSTSNIVVQARDVLPHGEHGHDLKLPLFRRAWTFQERKLSPRVIHFTEHELGWECGKGTWCECLSPFRLFEREQQLGKTNLDASSSLLTWQIEWHRIVSEYTGKNLTYSRDIFPALQGLAQRYSPVMGPYLAGLWDKNLVYSLTWFRTNRLKPLNPVPSGPLEEWRAPTWSWAAVDGKVKFSKIGDEAPRSFVSIESAMTVAKGNDPTGELSAGILRLKGRCLIGRLFKTKPRTWDDWLQLVITGEDNGQRQLPDIQIGETPLQSLLHGFHPTMTHYGGGVLWDHPYSDHFLRHDPSGYTQIILMKIDEMACAVYLSHDYQVEGWLVLCRESNGSSYNRIGVAKMVVGASLTRDLNMLYDGIDEEKVVTII